MGDILLLAGKKLRNGLKYSRVTDLPDTLCIHLKRFRHDFSFSSKISSKVTFPLVDLDMSPWLHQDCISKVKITFVGKTGIIKVVQFWYLLQFCFHLSGDKI